MSEIETTEGQPFWRRLFSRLLWIFAIGIGIFLLLKLGQSRSGETRVFSKPGKTSVEDKSQMQLDREARDRGNRLYHLAKDFAGDISLGQEERRNLLLELNISPDLIKYAQKVAQSGSGRLDADGWHSILRNSKKQYLSIAGIFEDLTYKPADRINASDIQKLLGDPKRANRLFEELESLGEASYDDYVQLAASGKTNISDWVYWVYHMD